MKKVLVVVVAFLVFGLATNAMAKMCDSYQWKPCHAKSCSSNLASSYGQMCRYHQWRMAHCKSMPVAKVAPAAPEKIVLEGVYFDTGSAKIKPESYSVLDANAAKLLKKKNVNVTIVGYTDNVGSVEKNKKLSEARAESVKKYLEGKGVAASRMNTKGMGPDSPIADNKTKEGRAKNRRIEMEMK